MFWKLYDLPLQNIYYVCLEGNVEMAYYSQRDGDRWKRLSSYGTRMPFQHFIKTHKASELWEFISKPKLLRFENSYLNQSKASEISAFISKPNLWALSRCIFICDLFETFVLKVEMPLSTVSMALPVNVAVCVPYILFVLQRCICIVYNLRITSHNRNIKQPYWEI